MNIEQIDPTMCPFNLQDENLAYLSRGKMRGVAKDLGVSARDVLEMEKRLSAHDASFDGPVAENDEAEIFVPSGYLEDQGPGPEEQIELLQHDHINP